MSAQYFTIEEAARIFRVAPKSVYRWLWSKKLKGRKFGGVWRIPASEVVGREGK